MTEGVRDMILMLVIVLVLVGCVVLIGCAPNSSTRPIARCGSRVKEVTKEGGSVLIVCGNGDVFQVPS